METGHAYARNSYAHCEHFYCSMPYALLPSYAL